MGLGSATLAHPPPRAGGVLGTLVVAAAAAVLGSGPLGGCSACTGPGPASRDRGPAPAVPAARGPGGASPAAPVGGAAPAASRPVLATPLTACASDADCVAVPRDCCGCTAGGTQATVTRTQAAAYEAARKVRCAEVVCVAMMSTDPSCARVPRCVDGGCRLVAPGDGRAPAAVPPPAAPQ